ncbi:MAG TPA: flagellar protein FlaG [Candidatus Lustribacter sp.]
MDVQTTGAVATIFPQLAPVQPPVAGAASSAAGALAIPAPVVSGPDSGSRMRSGADSSIGATPGLAILPAGPPDGSKKGAEADATLASGVAKLYNAAEQNVSVSFQIEQNPNEIVTVFTDKQTGKVIVQFPSETLIALAKFFDKLDGAVVNKKV